MFGLSSETTVFSRKISRLFVPYFSASLSKFLLLIVDSFVAGVFIGQDMLSAVALMSPILIVDEMLHDTLGSGVSRIMSKTRISQGDKASNEFIASVIIAVFVIYAVIIGSMLIFAKSIMGFFTPDAKLVALSLKYYYPIVAAMPFFEMLLCLENAYTIDGRPSLFASRPLISLIGNLTLDILFVTVFHWGVTGLAWASVISTALGYSVTIWHGFSKKCTVKPDFSVIKSFKKLKTNIIEDINIGKEYLIRNIAMLITSSIINKKAGAAGATALAIWYVVSKASDMLFHLSNSTAKSLFMIEGILLGEEDHEGVKKVAGETLKRLFFSGTLIAIIYLVFAPFVCYIFGINKEFITEASKFLRLNLICYPTYAYTFLARNHLITIGENNFARFIALAEQALAIVIVLLSPSRYFLYGVVLGYDAVYFISFITSFIIMRKLNVKSEAQENRIELMSCFFNLKNEDISQTSKKACDLMIENNYDAQSSNSLSLLIEECCLLLKDADNRRKKISAYIRIVISKSKLYVTIISDSAAADVSKLTENITSKDMLSALILKNKTDLINYHRIVDMNYIKMRANRNVYASVN